MPDEPKNEPRVVYKSDRTVYVYGHQVDLNGFRYGNCYTRPTNTRPLATPDGTYRYDDYRLGFSMPNLSDDPADPEREKNNQMWVAVFAHAWPEDRVATIGFVPFLRVDTGVDPVVPDTANGTTTVRFRASEGTLIADAFRDADVFICTKTVPYSPPPDLQGVPSMELVKAISNTTTTIKLQGTGLGLAADEYILPAPPDGREYQYLGSLKLRYDGTTSGKFDVFTFSQRRSYTKPTQVGPGGIGTDVTSATYADVSFRHVVSPLATGVVGTLQAYWATGTPASGDSAYLTVATDSSKHDIAIVGTDRLVSNGDGRTAPFLAGFGVGSGGNEARQVLAAKVNNGNVVGRILARGWVEG